jgi:broad specificity phosphatase PhoE
MGLLLLARHGQASFGADDYDVLSETGWEQGRALGSWLAREGFEPASIIHGGMRRHRETWEAIRDGTGWRGREAEVDGGWAEFDHHAVLDRYAAVTGTAVRPTIDRRAFQAQFEASTTHWFGASPEVGYPEPYDAFVRRARSALDEAAARPGPTLAVTSGGVIAAVAAMLVAPVDTAVGPIWARFNTVIANTSVSRVIVGTTGIRLLTFNEHPHLPRGLLTYR